MKNQKSDVNAKLAFRQELCSRGYNDVEIISAPADIMAEKDGEIWYFEIKMTKRTDTYFGAATETEWEQAFKDPEHYRFVIAQTNENEDQFKFIEITPEELMEASTIPPFKVYFNIDMQTGKPQKSEHRDSTLVLNKDMFDSIHKAYEEQRKLKSANKFRV